MQNSYSFPCLSRNGKMLFRNGWIWIMTASAPKSNTLLLLGNPVTKIKIHKNLSTAFRNSKP